MNREEIINALSQYFAVKELVCNHTYAKHGEKSWQFLDTDWLHCLLVIRRDILKVPMTCNHSTAHQRGLRCNMCELVKSKKANYLSAHCFDEATEILTTNGWKRHDNISEDDILYTYNIENGLIEKKTIAYITKENYVGKMVKTISANVDILTTEAHDLIMRSTEKKYIRIGNKKYTEKGIAYFNSLHKETDKWHKEPAINLVGKRRKLLCASYVAEERKCNLDLYKFCMAVIADGYFEYKKETPHIKFRFKKERKCAQIEDILNQLGWYYTKSLDKRGVWNYYIRSGYAKSVFEIIGAKKNIPMNILDFGADVIAELVKYYSLYDGCHSKRECDSHFTICTTNENNANMLQLMCALGGMRCNMSVKKAQDENRKPTFTLTINPETLETTVKKNNTSIVDYEGVVWCVSSENGTVIIRRNNKISIQGNCLGKAGDFSVKGMNAGKARQEIMLKAHLLPCPIRLEGGVSWLHFDVLPQYGVTEKVYVFNV